VTLKRDRANQDDANAIDHLLTCPRCAQLWPGDCRYCADCGSRLLPTEQDIADFSPHFAHSVDENLLALPYDFDLW
jgi:NADH pyrophosphatase NudC (nudix superfamily)